MRFVLIIMMIILFSCKKEDPYIWKELEVKATAYNSTKAQTFGNPSIAAWGDTLKPGMKCIAISRDLIALGIQHNTPVKIEGLDGIFLVKDKMHRRKRKQIDIYLGKDIKKAKAWGVKRLKIKYGLLKSELPNDSVR
ncbi:MAG: 3D domain-containing protein [Flavobacteriaceae bacterium]|nr:3D domain-containing protein [Flavobacteriaceae bacterium]